MKIDVTAPRGIIDPAAEQTHDRVGAEHVARRFAYASRLLG